ncbi:hypothetical protein HYW44_00615 [Candidatus Daviesbacteria bacterium]|nr:hypothetical protein [Candidatus Daviesbacteria bacterium]
MISPKLYQLQKDIASLLLDKLEKDQITIERAAQISKYVLQALPDNLTDEQIDKILPSLDDHFVELAGVVHQHLKAKEELEKQATVDQATKLIHQGNLDQAVKLMTNHMQQKI